MCADNRLYAATNGLFSTKKEKMGRGSGEGEVTNERLEFDHLKISDYGPLQSSDGRQE